MTTLELITFARENAVRERREAEKQRESERCWMQARKPGAYRAADAAKDAAKRHETRAKAFDAIAEALAAGIGAKMEGR